MSFMYCGAETGDPLPLFPTSLLLLRLSAQKYDGYIQKVNVMVTDEVRE